MADFILSCESTVDLPYSYVSGRNIPVIFYSYIVDGVSYVDDMGRNEDALPLFYDFIKQGKLPTTSQLNEFLYYDFFRDLLQKGDVLHIAFGSGMTPSVGNAYKAAEKLREEFPDRKLVIIDSLCSCSGYGLLVDIAADLRAIEQDNYDGKGLFLATGRDTSQRKANVIVENAASAPIVLVCDGPTQAQLIIEPQSRASLQLDPGDYHTSVSLQGNYAVAPLRAAKRVVAGGLYRGIIRTNSAGYLARGALAHQTTN